MDIGNVWIWIAALVLWLSPEARLVVTNCLTAAGRLFRGMDRFVQAIAAWSQVLLVLALILFFISIWVSPQVALVLKIAAIYILVAWTLILWATLAIAAGFVEAALGLMVPERREPVVNALRSPYKVLGIIITILVALGLQVFVWPGMPMYVGAFVALVIIGLLIIEVVSKKPITLRMAKVWFFIAILIFAGQVVWSYAKPRLEKGDGWVSKFYQNKKMELDQKATAESLKITGAKYLAKTLSVDEYKNRHDGFEPLILMPNGQDLPNYDENVKRLENQEFYVVAVGDEVPEIARARFGLTRAAVIQTRISRTNPTPVQYIVPVDFLEEEKKTGNTPILTVPLPGGGYKKIVTLSSRKWSERIVLPSAIDFLFTGPPDALVKFDNEVIGPITERYGVVRGGLMFKGPDGEKVILQIVPKR